MGNRLVRYLAAALLLMYGFSKINGMQFAVLDSELDKPMGQVSGFWLTWYYFGYSPVYKTLLAAVEITGALLLTSQRTAFLGACLLAPMLANILLIDVLYGVDLSAVITATFLLGVMIWLIAPRWAALKAFFLPTRDESSVRSKGGMQWGIRIAMLVAAWGFNHGIANYTVIAHTPLDGAWDVAQVEPPEFGAAPKTVYFEYNRGGWLAFRMPDGSSETHHFEVDPKGRIEVNSEGRLRMWQRWLKEGGQFFDGSYVRTGEQLTVRGDWQGKGPVTLRLNHRNVR